MLEPITFISPWLYGQIYYYTIGIITIFCIIRYSRYTENRVLEVAKKSISIPSIILGIIVLLFFGLRPISGAFVDMMNYLETYNFINANGIEPTTDTTNPVFNPLFSYLALNNYDIIIFFFIIAFIYIVGIYWSIEKIFPKDCFYALVIYLGAFSTFSYGTNGIKAGAAASIFLLVFAYYRKPLLMALFCLISLGFHHSMVVPIYALGLAFFIRNPKYYFIGWTVCLVLAIFHVTTFQELFANFTDEKGQNYLLADENSWGGKAGFRWDFILYSLPPMIIGLWTVYKHHCSDRLYQIMLCTYITCNAIWMLCMYMPYNNRLAYLSWFFLPIVLIYPFLKFKLCRNQYKMLNCYVGIYLAFSLLTCYLQ